MDWESVEGDRDTGELARGPPTCLFPAVALLTLVLDSFVPVALFSHIRGVEG